MHGHRGRRGFRGPGGWQQADLPPADDAAAWLAGRLPDDWFVGETFLFSRLFSYVHERTGFRELMPVNAATYFLQLVNMAVAGGAMVLFLNRRKQVHWLDVG